MVNQINRKELYDLVWSKPMKKIQEDFGLSYTQLKSICEEYKIPLPESGFWTKVAFQKEVNILPLLDYPGVQTIINLYGTIGMTKSETTSFTQIKKQVEIEMGGKVQVPKLIKNWHPLVARFREKYVVYQNELKKGNWSNALRGELNIQVKDSHVSRATRIFDTVIKIIESKGHSIFIDHFGTNIEIQEHTYQLSIRTKNKRVIDEDSNYSYQSTKLIPLDILIFKIARIYSFEFADTPNKPLEDKIESIIARLELLSIQDTKMKEDARRQNEIYQAQREEREAILKAQEQEKAKFEKLVQNAESWNKAVLISRYLDEMERKGNLTQEERAYISWGRKSTVKLISFS
jgi:hypothetical protein